VQYLDNIAVIIGGFAFIGIMLRIEYEKIRKGDHSD
jgi:hypothetical protein